MKWANLGKKSVRKKLIRLFLSLLLIATVLIGIFSFFIARKALDDKGEVILKNSVIQAVELIDSEQEKVQVGILSKEEAQENIKTKLSGPLNEDGTRFLDHEIDLGDNGYFIVYSKDGYEIMHPTLEGEYVWDVVDMKDNDYLIVQEQIKVGLSGGGYTYYSWLLPHSTRIGEKMSYSAYEPDWEWIVAATAYNVDFNAEARFILIMIIVIMVIIILIIALIVVHYIKRITKPVVSIVKGLELVTEGEYKEIEISNTEDEIAFLGKGYNNMIRSLIEANDKIMEKNAQLAYLAYHDELTGLPNRHGLKEYVMSIRENECSFGYLVQLDIAGLKVINSTLGFEEGDRILALIGVFLQESVYKKYHISRTSSNEFSMWINEESLVEVKDIIYLIRDDVKEYVLTAGYNQGIDLHMSMALCENHNSWFDKLYEEATMAMKVSKEKKDFMLHIYEEGMRQAMENELLMRKHLSDAIHNHEIIPYYQGKVDYRNDAYVGVEALARWDSEKLGVVSPGVFIPAMRKQHLIHEFTDYIIDKVFNDYQKIMTKYGSDVSVSINIPPSYFLEKDFIIKINDALEYHDMPADKLILEITEDVLIGDYDSITKTIEALHKIGVRLSIDDFGTGYSSLIYLINMDFDEMKIDKSFIDQIQHDRKAFELFKILCQLAEIYGYIIIAEGVETNDQLDLIKTTSLNIIQGFLFSKPEPL